MGKELYIREVYISLLLLLYAIDNTLYDFLSILCRSVDYYRIYIISHNLKNFNLNYEIQNKMRI